MQRIDPLELKGTVSYVLMGIDQHLETARTDPAFTAVRNRLVAAVFRRLAYNAVGEERDVHSGYFIADEGRALELLKGEHGREAAALATLLVTRMIEQRNRIPEAILDWLSDVLKGEPVYRLSEVKPGRIGQGLLLRHLAKVSSAAIRCHATSKNHGVITGSVIVRECLLQFEIDMKMSTLNREVSDAKKYKDYYDFGVQVEPNQPVNALAYPISHIGFSAEKAGLGPECIRVMRSLAELKSVEIL